MVLFVHDRLTWFRSPNRLHEIQVSLKRVNRSVWEARSGERPTLALIVDREGKPERQLSQELESVRGFVSYDLEGHSAARDSTGGPRFKHVDDPIRDSGVVRQI
ncbi:MAG TPA: hypothetical protein VFN24_07175, partial [Microbacterium sp.]|nr:hypothetical protein [Microbacterium sp.]